MIPRRRASTRENKQQAKERNIVEAAAKGDITLNEYAKFVDAVWLNEGKLKLRDHYIMTVGLSGETGEVMELLKKWVRDGKLDRDQLKKELGDILYYLVRIATAHDLNPQEVMSYNVTKLADRWSRGVLKGNGNDR